MSLLFSIGPARQLRINGHVPVITESWASSLRNTILINSLKRRANAKAEATGELSSSAAEAPSPISAVSTDGSIMDLSILQPETSLRELPRKLKAAISAWHQHALYFMVCLLPFRAR